MKPNAGGMIMADEHWHLDKKVPIALIFAILLQTGAAIWWAAKISSRVEVLETSLGEHRNGPPHKDVEPRLRVMESHLEEILSELRALRSTMLDTR